MNDKAFQMSLYLPIQGLTETVVTVVEWQVAEGDHFEKNQVIMLYETAKALYDFEAPCAGKVVKLLRPAGEIVPYNEPIMEIETTDSGMKNWIPPAFTEPVEADVDVEESMVSPAVTNEVVNDGTTILGIGGYLPSRVVTNEELVVGFPEINADYIYQVSGIRERRWAANGEKPSDMAYKASIDAIRDAGIPKEDIDAIILSTTTPDFAMPSTACILQNRLGLRGIPAFDLNAACSGWLYAVSMARGMILSGLAKNVLTVGVDLQSRLLDKSDRSTYFIFGDGAGAAVISSGTSGHLIRRIILGADSKGLRMARREEPGYCISEGCEDFDPWIRLEGPALFRFATESFAKLIRDVIIKSGWKPAETRWVIPHQANGRILKAAAKQSGVSFDRFYLNIETVGNTSSASIPLALVEIKNSLKPVDKLILCSVGAGVTSAAISVEW
ncbi:beta-ketoacyl-ACP synthase 3 [bacterium]|nr:beta-ketoacyl-ACP synthase 3 [bacterium]